MAASTPRPPATLTTLPSLAYREIIQYLAPQIILRCGTSQYLTLQRCCNPIFAREVRSIIKEKLQYQQAAIAIRFSGFALRHHYVIHNPIYKHSLTPDDIGNFLPHTIDPNPDFVEFFPKVFVAFCGAWAANAKPVSGAKWLVHGSFWIIRKAEAIAEGVCDIRPGTYELWRDAVLYEVGAKDAEKFDWGCTFFSEESEVRVTFLVSSSGKVGRKHVNCKSGSYSITWTEF